MLMVIELERENKQHHAEMHNPQGSHYDPVAASIPANMQSWLAEARRKNMH